MAIFGEDPDKMSAKTSKITIVTPHKYSAWPLIGSVKGKLICTYTVADQHNATDTTVYLKTSDTNGQTWSEPTEIFTDKTGVKGATSVGYGASFGGVTALLAMLNSCASGISVVNIDNGFGAAYQASLINHLGGAS